MAEIISGEVFDSKIKEFQIRYLELDKKWASYRRLARLGLFSVGRRIGGDSESELEIQKWVELLKYPGMRVLLNKAQQHTLTENEYKRLVSFMEKQNLWP